MSVYAPDVSPQLWCESAEHFIAIIVCCLKRLPVVPAAKISSFRASFVVNHAQFQSCQSYDVSIRLLKARYGCTETFPGLNFDSTFDKIDSQTLTQCKVYTK